MRASIRSASKSATRSSALVDEKQGGTLLKRVRAIRRQIAHRDRRRRAAGARRRQPAARAARLHAFSSRASRSRAASSTPIACWPSTPARRRAAARRRADARAGVRAAGDLDRRRAARRARRRPATPWSIRRRRCRRTCRRRSAPSCRTCSAGSRPRSWSTGRADVAEAGRGAGAEAGVARRHPARAAAAAARARAGARPGHDPRGDRRRRVGHQGPRRDHRGRARAIGRAICRPYQNEKGELPVIGVAPALEEQLMASLVRTDQGAVLALDPQQAQSIASRIAKRARAGDGTACALVLAGAAAAPLAAVRAGAAAPRRAVARRGAAARAGRPRCDT